MIDKIEPNPNLFKITINGFVIRFFLEELPTKGVWVALPELLLALHCPRGLRRTLVKRANQDFRAQHRTIQIQGKKVSVTPISISRTIVVDAVNRGFCPPSAFDLYEVISEYAQDRLLNRDPPVCADLFDAIFAGPSE